MHLVITLIERYCRRMQSALRKIGNSTGLVLPKAILREIGLASGAVLDLKVDDGRLVATPVARRARAGWAESAAEVANGDDAESAAWRGFGNAGDVDLKW